MKSLPGKTHKSSHQPSPKPRARKPNRDAAADSILRLQQTMGNRGVGRMLQAQLKVNAPGDVYEQEADRVAEKVMRMEKPSASTPADGSRAIDSGQQSISSNSHAGKPLDAEAQRFFASRFGHDFSKVRVHPENESARELQARAYTMGNDITFAPGEYRPAEKTGRNLLAHELAHVVQQQTHSPPAIQRKAPEQTSQTNQPAAKATAGAPTDVLFFIMNPGLEKDRGLQAAINLLRQYSPQVPTNKVEIRLLPESERGSVFGEKGGDSFWEGSIPVVRLPQDALDIVAKHSAGKATVAEMHGVIRTIGHEMHHLRRAKEGHRENPIQPIYEKEAAQRMKQVRANWLRDIQNGAEEIPGVPRTIKRFEDISKKQRETIEKEATSTDYIQGLYERSAYVIEEIYTRVNELAFLRVQQQNEPATTGASPSRSKLSEIAHQIYFMKNQMESMMGPDNLVTPQLWQKAQQAMLKYLRGRYPNRQSSRAESYEVLFYQSAMRGGMPPLQ